MILDLQRYRSGREQTKRTRELRESLALVRISLADPPLHGSPTFYDCNIRTRGPRGAILGLSEMSLLCPHLRHRPLVYGALVMGAFISVSSPRTTR